jgi:hypothetical protein
MVIKAGPGMWMEMQTDPPKQQPEPEADPESQETPDEP